MYQMYLQAMYLTDDGWVTLRDDAGQVFKMGNLTQGNDTREALLTQDGVLDAMLVKVEEAEVYQPHTRQRMTHTTYTGLTNA